ncbi:MAG: hypothetical protein ACK47R_10215, partial [Planctomycetia bacterium]
MRGFFRKFFSPRNTFRSTRKTSLRGLELLGLEDRIVPAVFTSDSAGLITIQLAQNESFTGLEVSINNSPFSVTFNTTSTNNVLGTQSADLSVISPTEIRYTPANLFFTGVSILGTTAGTNE